MKIDSATFCPKCKKPVIFQCDDETGGVYPGDEYVLIADSIFHNGCWDKLVEEHPP